MKNNLKIHERNFKTSPLVMNHTDIITSIAKQFNKVKSYIEFGYADGGNLDQMIGLCENIYVVDIIINQRPNYENVSYFEMTTDEFCEKHLPEIENIEMAFIDADHTSEQVIKDFDNLFAKLEDNGIIFMHDTYPVDVKFTRDGYCSDSYRVPDIIKNKYKDLIEVVTIPISPGLTIIRKRYDLDFMKKNEKLDNEKY